MSISLRTISLAGLLTLPLCACNTTAADPGAPTGATPIASTGEATDSGAGSTTQSSSTSSGSGSSTGISAEIDCSALPPAAVGADYDYTLQVSPHEGQAWSWTAEGLPDGMGISLLTGQLGGAPTEAGSFEFTATAASADGDVTTDCQVEVADALSVDFDGLGGPCVRPEHDLSDFVSGGDGTPMTCSLAAGSGAGPVPEGVSVGTENCLIEGSSSDTFGTWAWIVRVQQSGHSLFVPYCYTQDDPGAAVFVVRADHSGGMDNVLEPAVRSYGVGDTMDFGTVDDMHFEVLGMCGDGGPCNYGYTFNINASPFGNCGDDVCFGMSPASLLPGLTGFDHTLWARGQTLSEPLTRPAVLSWLLHYCMTGNDIDCSGSVNVNANAGATLRFSMIANPL